MRVRSGIRHFLRHRRGIAAVEFAIVAPVFLSLLLGVADFGLALRDQSRMAIAVTAGADYAFNKGQVFLHSGGRIASLTSDVQARVNAALDLPGAQVPSPTLSVYCIAKNTGSTPPSATLTTGTPGALCPDGDLPGTYIVITCQYTYTPVAPLYTMLANTYLVETARVRLW